MIWKFAIMLGALAPMTGAAFADSYSVEFAVSSNPRNNGQHRVANVEAIVTPRDGAVGLVRSAGDVGLPNGWATFLYTIEAADQNGAALTPRYLGSGRWKLTGWSEGPVTLTYTMLLQHDRFPNDPGEDELAYARDWGVMWTGRALFMEGAESAAPVNVSFSGPDDWVFSTPWRSASKDGRHFIAKNTDDLLDSAFMAGTHIEKSIPVAGNVARLGVAPPLSEVEPIMSATLKNSLAAYKKLFAANMPDALLVLLGDSYYSGGGVMGRSISIILGDDENNMPAYIAAHESFHVWNSQWRYDDANGDTEWLKEGLAEYYTYVAGARTGVMAKDAVIADFADRAGRYLTALKTDSIAGGGAKKLQSEASYHLVYSGGMMLCAALDADIRKATGGRKSLDDLVAALHRDLAHGAPLTVAALADAIKKLSGADTEAFFATYLYGDAPLPLAELFGRYGLDSAIAESDGDVAVTLTEKSAPSTAERAAMRAWLE